MDIIPFLRQFKIGPFAIFDTVISYVGIYLLAPLLTKLFLKIHIRIPLESWLWLMLPISIIVHLIFSQSTPLVKFLLDPHEILAKVVLLAMLYMGARKITFGKK